MLINVAAPKKQATGMDASSALIRPGHAPPFISPHCRQCGVPVEEFTIDPAADGWTLGVQVTCHGKTSGRKLSAHEVLEAKARNRPVWFF